MTTSMHDVRAMLGSNLDWCGGTTKFRFEKPRDLYTVAIGYVEEFATDWTEEELVRLKGYTKFGEFEPYFGPKCDLCLKEDKRIVFLIFEEFGSPDFEQLGNSTLPNFVGCVNRLGQTFGRPGRPSTNSLVHALLDIVTIDEAISDETYWWNLVTYFIDMENIEEIG